MVRRVRRSHVARTAGQCTRGALTILAENLIVVQIETIANTEPEEKRGKAKLGRVR